VTDVLRFMHAADLHLDAPFRGVEAQDERVRRALVASTYDAFGRVVDACIERDVAFLVIAGDVYNSRDKSLKAQLAFRVQLERLDQAGIETYLVHGNHDPASGWSAGLTLPGSVRVFSSSQVERFEVRRDGELRCALYGRSFDKAAETANFAREFSRDASDPVAIGVLHTNAGGNTDFEPYAPCSLDDLRAAQMDYWALGHIHKPGRIIDSPRAVYAGSPQGLNPKETGSHGCYLVEIAGGTISEEFVETASVRWESAALAIDELESVDDVRAALLDVCSAIRERSSAPAVVRIDLEGRSSAHSSLVRANTLADLVADVREDALSGHPWLWIDRVRDLTAPAIDIEAVRAAPDFAGDLVRLVDELLADPAQAASLISSVTEPLEASVGPVDLERTAQQVVERARVICLDRLLEGGER
jgi:exonuclease SbcD